VRAIVKADARWRAAFAVQRFPRVTLRHGQPSSAEVTAILPWMRCQLARSELLRLSYGVAVRAGRKSVHEFWARPPKKKLRAESSSAVHGFHDVGY
jgi:hypothetical protein